MHPVDELRAYTRFTLGLRRFLRNPVEPGEILKEVTSRLVSREHRFVEIARDCIYAHPASPYRALLHWAGCEFGDFSALVRSEGIEGALTRLRGEGVFLTVDEFKMKQPVRRGSKQFIFRERDLDNPLSKGTLIARTGASRSRGTRTVYDFRNLSESWTAHFLLRLQTFGLLDHPIAAWYPIMPGAGPIVVLSFARAGIYIKWFSPLTGTHLLKNLRSRCGNAFVVRWGQLVDRRFPAPEFVPFDAPGRVADWAALQLRRSGRCTLLTYVSAAVRVAQAALCRGMDLSGMVFSVTSEPITEAKRREMEASGARVVPSYASMETGTIGAGCRCGSSADDMHLLNDTVAMIQFPRRVEHADLEVDALLLTGLLDSFPKVLFNTETGDCGILEQRRCGCPFEELGFDWHLRSVYGFDKLTAGGMTFVGSDLVRILEEVLPRRFGGTSLDYQLVEEEREGQTRLCLVVSPALGALQEGRLKEVFLSELRKGSEANRLMSKVWDACDTLQVRRDEPSTTVRGKLLPLHLSSQHPSVASARGSERQ